jgi:hypothetical protein
MNLVEIQDQKRDGLSCGQPRASALRQNLCGKRLGNDLAIPNNEGVCRHVMTIHYYLSSFEKLVCEKVLSTSVAAALAASTLIFPLTSMFIAVLSLWPTACK